MSSRKALKWLRSLAERRQGGLCIYCGRVMLPTALRRGRSSTADHVIPLARGGKTELNNIVACCKSCNERKGCGDEPIPRKNEPPPDMGPQRGLGEESWE